MIRSHRAALLDRSANLRRGCWATCLTLLFTMPAAAQVEVFTEQAVFLAQTAAIAEPPIPGVGLVGRTGATYTLGSISFAVSTTDPDVALILDEWTAINPGNEVVMSGVEDLDVIIDHPVTSLGFYFVEGTGSEFCTAPCPCADATFQVTLRMQGALVGSFAFNATDDVLSFCGVRSSAPFDRVEFRDASLSCDNEVWGRFFLGDGAACPADINGSGGLSVQDIFDFLAFYFAGDARGDFNGSGLPVTVQDIFDFLAAYFAGCP